MALCPELAPSRVPSPSAAGTWERYRNRAAGALRAARRPTTRTAVVASLERGRHAGRETFTQLEDLLADPRGISLSGIVERRTGVLHRGSTAFVHFHDDPDGPDADVRLEPAADVDRYRVRTAAERRRLLTCAGGARALRRRRPGPPAPLQWRAVPACDFEARRGTATPVPGPGSS